MIPEPEMEEFYLPDPIVKPIAKGNKKPVDMLVNSLSTEFPVSTLEKAMFNLNMVSRDEFDSSDYDLDQFEAHFEEIEDHQDCLVCRYYRTCTFAPQPPAGPPNSQFSQLSGRSSPVNIV